MSPIRQSLGVAVGQLDPTQFSEYEELASATAGFAAAAVVVYLVGRLLIVPGVTRLVSARNRNNPTLKSATETYAHAFVIVVAAVAGVVGAGYPSVLTDTALVVGVAGQEVIGALISGLFLVADPDFNVGDWISWPGGEGVIEAVDFRVTRVRTVNNETISVPNTELTTNALTRPYGRERYRITERVDVAYDDDTELALRELVETAREDDRVLDEPEPTARILEFAGSSVGLQAEFWVASPMDVNLVDVRSQYRRRVKRRFDGEGLTLGPASGREVSGRLGVDLVGGRGGE